MDYQASMEREAAYEPAARSLILAVNRRMGNEQPLVGQLWVRMRPPTEEEFADERLNPRVVRFHRIGNVVKVTTVLPDFVEIECGGQTLMVGLPEFLCTWVRLVTDDAWG